MDGIVRTLFRFNHQGVDCEPQETSLGIVHLYHIHRLAGPWCTCDAGVSQTCCAVSHPFPLTNPAVLHADRVLRGKHDHLAVGERVFMVLDATIRPTGRVGLQPGAGLKRFTPSGQSDAKGAGIMYARRAVVLQRFLGACGWASGLAVSPPSVACRRDLTRRTFCALPERVAIRRLTTITEAMAARVRVRLLASVWNAL